MSFQKRAKFEIGSAEALREPQNLTQADLDNIRRMIREEVRADRWNKTLNTLTRNTGIWVQALQAGIPESIRRWKIRHRKPFELV